MSPNGISSGFDEIFITSTSDSSDSESLLQEDVKSSGSQISQQWEAIERTLYQEPGPQVTDSELLKECKLWRETFPHFRVKGTKLDVKQVDNEPLVESEKSIQTLKNHFDLKKLEEKRQDIKTKVVGMLVERLIAKYSPDKESANTDGNVKNGVQIAEIDENRSENFSNASSNKSGKKNLETVVSTDNESYFERGKLLNGGTVQDELDEEEEELRGILDSWKDDTITARKLPKSYRTSDFRKLETPKNNFTLKSPEKAKPKKFTPPSNSLGSITKPFEMTKKIDKKYEGLVDKIFERKANELDTIRHCRTSASGLDMRNFEESLEKLRIGSAFDDYLKRTSKMRINKFDNNWLKRSEMNFANTDDVYFSKKTKNIKPSKKMNLHSEESKEEIDDKFIENLKREMALNYKRPPMRSGVIEEISLRRPKPIRPAVEKSPKSFSCGDLQKKNKKETKSRQLRNGFETGKNDTNFKKPGSHLINKGSRLSANQSQLLPPIESGIICTELTGRPKIGAKIPPKRY